MLMAKMPKGSCMSRFPYSRAVMLPTVRKEAIRLSAMRFISRIPIPIMEGIKRFHIASKALPLKEKMILKR